MGEGKCCTGFGKRVCQFIAGKSSIIGWVPIASLKLRESERVQISPEDFSWRNARAVKIRARAD